MKKRITRRRPPRQKAAAGSIYLLRTCAADGSSYNGFRWPLTVGARVAAPDWDSQPRCGGGLHGLPSGIGGAGLLSFREDAHWLVFRARRADVVAIDAQKAKARRGTVAYVGDKAGALGFLAAHGCDPTAVVWAQATASGDRGQATASGDRGQATASGDGGHSISRHVARAGALGTALCLWWDGERERVVVGYVGEDGVKPNVWYRADGGRLVEVADDEV